MDKWINRCGGLAGSGQFVHPAQGILAFWIHSFRERNALQYIGFDGLGNQVRDCWHPCDLATLLQKQFVEPAESAKPRVVNVAGGVTNSMSLSELTSWCQIRFKGLHDMTPSPCHESRPFDIPWTVLDALLAAEIRDWRPETPIMEILEEIAEFSESHPDWLCVTLG